ncbi:hypothetical protein [Phenylobacterium sp.]|uniref:hypothetical protein n=1 Tax=Phenylobacterium sp. TaxID=1871053 RepID=UPI0035B1EA56
MPRNQIRLTSSPSAARRVVATASALAIALGAVAPAFAQDAGEQAAVERTKAQTEQTKAETDRIKAETDKAKAQMDALGLSPAKGETTLGEGAGKMEAYMLSGAAMNTAARMIAAQATGPTIVVGGEEAVDLSLPETLHTQMEAVTEEARTLVAMACAKGPAPNRDNRLKMLTPGTMAAIGAVVSALKVDTEIRGIEIDTASDRAFVNAVASYMQDAVVLSEAVLPANFRGSTVSKDWRELRSARDEVTACHARLVQADKKDAAAKVATSVGQIDAFMTALTKAEAGGSPFVRAAILEQAVKPGVRVLRVASEYTGGSLVQRTNLWTMFGATGVSLTGGLVASYRLVDPTTGRVARSGLLICRTAHTNLTKVQNGDVGAGSCTQALRTGAE